jgi:hypothetical protein
MHDCSLDGVPPVMAHQVAEHHACAMSQRDESECTRWCVGGKVSRFTTDAEITRVTSQGQVAIVKTSGNADGHLILRGGASGPNYDKDSISAATELLKKNKVCYTKVACCIR